MAMKKHMNWSQRAVAHTLRYWLSRRRIFVLLVIMFITGSCGACAGHFLGKLILKERTEMIADQFVSRIQQTLDSAITEEYDVLYKLKKSPYTLCSDADLVWMRQLIYHSEYIGEVGHMTGDSIACSATLGRVNLQALQSEQDFTYKNGDKIRLNPDGYKLSNHTVLMLQREKQFVVLRPVIETFFSSAPLSFAITDLDQRTQRKQFTMGTLRDTPDWILLQEKEVTWKDTAYATRCEAQIQSCITAGMPLSTAMHLAGGGIRRTTEFGAVLGTLFPLLAVFLFNRDSVMALQLRHAIRANILQLVYMPVVNLKNRQVVGAEALLRWTDESGKAVSPEVFVRVAEERGFIDEITAWVMHKSLSDFGAHLRSHPDFRMSVNATATDFSDPKFLPMLRQTLEQAGVSPQSLIVEITESSTARRKEVGHTIRQLRQLGCHVHIDDFGTGYSSLAYLHELSVNAIKIDKSFTQAIDAKATHEVILPQIMAMADSLHLEVVVEGIETEQQARYFTAQDKPRRGQGWLFGPPVSMATFNDLYIQQESL
ncbi:EAL domain-containing protein [Telmatobacter bradus]|uniref:EAL domain-containing protein n=1 Tax=Telmatobacter bradus TaxID=474953 RepID=UPI003B4390C6